MNPPAPIRSGATLCRNIRAALKPLTDPVRAAGARAYMRSQFQFLGVSVPRMRTAIAPLLRSYKPADASALLATARSLWRMREREYQGAAVDLLVRRNRILTARELPQLLALVQQKSWWDSVDGLAKVIGLVVRREKRAGQRVMDRCVRSKNLWVRRVAMIHQLGWRAETDTARLFAYAERLAPESDFFIRKAIGWALRAYAYHDPEAVRNFVASTRARLSPLTLREATKHLGPESATIPATRGPRRPSR